MNQAYFVANVTFPVLAPEVAKANSFFVFAATINLLAVVAWIFMNPPHELQRISPSALRWRLVNFVALLVAMISAVLYTQILMR